MSVWKGTFRAIGSDRLNLALWRVNFVLSKDTSSGTSTTAKRPRKKPSVEDDIAEASSESDDNKKWSEEDLSSSELTRRPVRNGLFYHFCHFTDPSWQRPERPYLLGGACVLLSHGGSVVACITLTAAFATGGLGCAFVAAFYIGGVAWYVEGGLLSAGSALFIVGVTNLEIASCVSELRCCSLVGVTNLEVLKVVADLRVVGNLIASHQWKMCHYSYMQRSVGPTVGTARQAQQIHYGDDGRIPGTEGRSRQASKTRRRVTSSSAGRHVWPGSAALSQASQPVPPTNETREEKIVIPEDNTEVNDIGEMDEEAESHANSEGDKLAAAAEGVEILGNDAEAEVDVVRDKEINIDPEENKTVEEEIIDKVVLDKVASIIVRQDLEPLDHAVPVVLGDLHTQGSKQCPREKVHAQSGTQEAPKQNALRRKGESDALFNRPRHHSTDTKADALRMSDVENGKVRERTRSLSETAATALTKDAAVWWKTNQYFAESYEDFEEMLLDNYDSKEVWDQLSAQLGRRNKSTTETMAEFLQQKGVLARRLKLEDELHLPQLVDMFGPAVLPYAQASQPVPPTNETREEKIVIPEDNTEVNDIGEMDEEAESHANSEGDELAAAAEGVEILTRQRN
ncbi:hypothetical protein FQA39_LY11181 [Lamprigera yunnana]|nr:hypothetical protein FQA39_LY11181 [Lamprigera yunnana]